MTMGSNRLLEEKIAKTAIVFAVVEGISAAVALVDSRVGLLFALGVNALTLYRLNEFGKSRRAGANLANGLYGMFAARANVPTNDTENTLRNIANGGAYVFDEAAQVYERITSRR
jgi:hypothetical protein